MSRSRKKKRNEISLRNLTRNTTWVGFVVFVFASLCIYVVFAVAFSLFLGYFFESKVRTETEKASSIVETLEASGISGEEGFEAIRQRVDRLGHDYYITDENKNNVLYSKGEPEFFDNGSNLNIVIADSRFRLYSNSSIGFFVTENGAESAVDLVQLIRYLNDNPADKLSFGDLKNNIATVPFWVEMSVMDGKYHIFIKLDVDLGLTDVFYVLAFFGVISAIMMIVMIVLIVNAITNAVRRQKTIKLLFTDPVTKGHNWLWFSFYGNQLIRKRRNRNRSYAVVTIDVVKYSNFCICHSLSEGEEMLYRISEILEKNRIKKEYIAHAAGSSFAMLLKYTDEERIKRRVTHIIEQLQQISDEHKFNFHAGIAVVDASASSEKDKKGRVIIDIEKEYNYACAARDELAGSDDSGVVLLDDKMIADQKWIDIVHEKQQAALDNEEFLIYYQPKYNPQNDELTGAEALIRWQSPEYGFVTPNRIIPIFEQNGFITKIDHYMIRHVARDQKRWLDAGYKCVPVSVNVSRAHFIEDDLAEQIRDLVDSEGCPHEYIEIELTESAFFDDKKALLTTIGRLKGYGFAVSMDDFGSGYSSLNSLKDMPLDVLKLDAEFFRGEQGDGRGQIVVAEAIKLAKYLNMRTVAEGVEMREQVDFLAEQGCDMIQGYFYAKPMPGSDYEERMKQGSSAEEIISETVNASETGNISETENISEAVNAEDAEKKE